MLKGLRDEPSLRLVVSCCMIGDLSKRGDRQFARKPCSLSITVCGPFELFDEIGTWFQEYDIYLQDPAHAVGFDMRYCNPHRLSFNDLQSCGLVSTLLAQNTKHVGFEPVAEQPDALDILSSHADLEEAMQPQMISTPLKRCLRFLTDVTTSHTLTKYQTTKTPKAGFDVYAAKREGLGVRRGRARHLGSQRGPTWLTVSINQCAVRETPQDNIFLQFPEQDFRVF